MKETLESIVKKEEINLDLINIDELLHFMMQNIGNPDAYLRDDLIYRGSGELILNEKLTVEQLIVLLNTCMDDKYLYLNITHNCPSDDVFTRSFSALVIALILGKDRENRKLPEALILETIQRSVDYLMLEKDYRGFVHEKGWAHTVAHGSDLLAEAIAHPLMKDLHLCHKALQSLKSCLHTDYAFIDDEEERMLPVIDALLDKGLTDEQLLAWVKDLNEIEIEDWHTKYRYEWNVKKFEATFLRHLLKTNKCVLTTNWIIEA
ncbi:DUF2785 domain-containing protein [Solibacillus sp. A46]|uniref:DUF2785 domain-containing protein n=1 Tax=Solibacillus faecavium TaxID=2762221 RepID=A0ABR8XWD3_9BACL|nr:DUF2785 domain-containing protein [Solibacillus faecavium]MBD8036253.1 DUF2785 domain-containing protein [Solibacillus faecavium]